MGWQQRELGASAMVSQDMHSSLVQRIVTHWQKLCAPKVAVFVNLGAPGTPLMPSHPCTVASNGDSGVMEPVAILNVHKWLCSHQVTVNSFVVDNDSSIKARLKWSNEDHMANAGTTKAPAVTNGEGKEVLRPNCGKAPAQMPEPGIVADPNHMQKTLASTLHALVSLPRTDPALDCLKKKPPKRKRKTVEWSVGMHKMDCRRLLKNCAFVARVLKPTDLEEKMLTAGKAALEHHFNNHEFCGEWCHIKRGNSNNKKEQCCRNKSNDTDAKLHAKLHEIVARFIAIRALREVSHPMDTCANESFNNTIAWVAPKNKVHCGSCSLPNRINIAVGIKALGLCGHCTKSFDKLGVEMTQGI